MAGGDARTKKENYFSKLNELTDYNVVFIVNVDNVGSNQMHQIRKSLRGKAVVLMGKNTMVRRALRNAIPENPQFEKLLALVRGNIGFVFTKEISRRSVMDPLQPCPGSCQGWCYCSHQRRCACRKHRYGPGKTSFFQAIGIATKIARGTIEIISDVEIITAGNKVGASEAQLLNMLNISPFTYGLTIVSIYDNGTVFDTAMLDITDEVLISHVLTGIANVTAVSLALSYPTVASVPHVFINGYKNLLAVGLALEEYTFEASDKIKAILADPSRFAAAPVAAASAAVASSGSSAPAAMRGVRGL
ncbi:hypothetical protein BSLG_003436 [Batrachochytrium salamandrivorans]|nr:hypothetical protein BSLG_003436 [Batrachochytrium salamandrivorans]